MANDRASDEFMAMYLALGASKATKQKAAEAARKKDQAPKARSIAKRIEKKK